MFKITYNQQQNRCHFYKICKWKYLTFIQLVTLTKAKCEKVHSTGMAAPVLQVFGLRNWHKWNCTVLHTHTPMSGKAWKAEVTLSHVKWLFGFPLDGPLAHSIQIHHWHIIYIHALIFWLLEHTELQITLTYIL